MESPFFVLLAAGKSASGFAFERSHAVHTVVLTVTLMAVRQYYCACRSLRRQVTHVTAIQLVYIRAVDMPHTPQTHLNLDRTLQT